MGQELDTREAAIIRLLREQELRPGGRLEVRTLQRLWAQTGLRKSDLPQGLIEVELAGIVRVGVSGRQRHVELTDAGEALIYDRLRAESPLRLWLEQLKLKHRIRRGKPAAAPGVARRAVDRKSPTSRRAG